MPRCIVLALAGALMLAAPARARMTRAPMAGCSARATSGHVAERDVGLFLNSALAVAVDPRDSNHLLLGTISV